MVYVSSAATREQGLLNNRVIPNWLVAFAVKMASPGN